MAKIVTIPDCMKPYVVMVNGRTYIYPAGETVEVPDAVAKVIEMHTKAMHSEAPQANVVAPVAGAGGFTHFVEDKDAVVTQNGQELDITFSKNAAEVLITLSAEIQSDNAYLAIAPKFPDGTSTRAGEYRGGNKKYVWIRLTRDMWHKWGSAYLAWAEYGTSASWQSCSVAHTNNTVTTQEQPVVSGMKISQFTVFPTKVGVYIKEG